MRLVMMPVVSAMSSTCLTLTSPAMSSLTARSSSPVAGSSTGMRIFCSGWRTLIETLRRRASTSEVTRCARAMRSSRRASIASASHAGNAARWTDSSAWRPLTAFRSQKMRSEMNGAKGAAICATVSRQV